MKTVIVGPGAIGCLFAGLLTEGLERAQDAEHSSVWLLDKYPERALAISQQGVCIEVGSESRSVATRTRS